MIHMHISMLIYTQYLILYIFHHFYFITKIFYFQYIHNFCYATNPYSVCRFLSVDLIFFRCNCTRVVKRFYKNAKKKKNFIITSVSSFTLFLLLSPIFFCFYSFCGFFQQILIFSCSFYQQKKIKLTFFSSFSSSLCLTSLLITCRFTIHYIYKDAIFFY